MSQKNRKLTYDKLIAAGKEDKISEALKNEFGTRETPKIVEENNQETFKKVATGYKKGGK